MTLIQEKCNGNLTFIEKAQKCAKWQPPGVKKCKFAPCFRLSG